MTDRQNSLSEEAPEAVSRDVALAAKGDGDAFSRLARRFTPALSAILAPYRLTAEEREDLFQEGLLGLYKAVMLYDPRQSSFSTFAFVCMRSGATDGLRRLRRAVGTDPVDPEELPASPQFDPARILVGKEELSAALQKIDRVLSPMERDVLIGHARGETAEEIARRLGKEKRSVENALFRGRAKLRAASAHESN